MLDGQGGDIWKECPSTHDTRIDGPPISSIRIAIDRHVIGMSLIQVSPMQAHSISCRNTAERSRVGSRPWTPGSMVLGTRKISTRSVIEVGTRELALEYEDKDNVLSRVTASPSMGAVNATHPQAPQQQLMILRRLIASAFASQPSDHSLYS